MTSTNGADVLVAVLKKHGAKRVYGIPGGDCSLDIIDALSKVGMEFVLTRSETAAAIMAATDAAVGGGVGVVLTIRGPGITNAMNGVALAWLDRFPIVVIGDGYERHLDAVTHQRLDQMALLKPLSKAELLLDEDKDFEQLDATVAKAHEWPHGPVYIEMVGEALRRPIPVPAETSVPAAEAGPDEASLSKAREMLAKAKRPVIIAGLEAADPETAAALTRLAHDWQAPVLTTYMAKGAIPDSDPLGIGCYITGVIDEPFVKQSDLIVLFGTDPIEMLPGKWKYDLPLLEIARKASTTGYYPDDRTSVSGSLTVAAEKLKDACKAQWDPAALKEHKELIRTRSRPERQLNGISPQEVVEVTRELAPANARMAVDAGAFMMSAMSLWDADEPRHVMISRGLATMGTGLPAAIGSAKADPSRHQVVFTGDGGMMMCTGELSTAAQLGNKITVVVFNDAALSMIAVKQEKRNLPRAGTDFGPADFSTIARGFGCLGLRVDQIKELRPALESAFAHDGVSVVDVRIDPSDYDRQTKALRG